MSRGPRKLAVTPEMIERLALALRGQGWRTSKDLCAAIGWADRVVRAVVAKADGQIISSYDGFKLLSDATREEIDAALLQLAARKSAIQQRERDLAAARQALSGGVVEAGRLF